MNVSASAVILLCSITLLTSCSVDKDQEVARLFSDYSGNEMPGAAVLAGRIELSSSPGAVTQTITNINVGETDRIMLIFGVDNADGDDAAFDNIVLVGPDPPVDPEDTDGDGLNDEWELDHFGDLSQGGTNDFDSDLFSNAAEQDLGTLPNDAGSTPELNLHVSFDDAGTLETQFLRYQQFLNGSSLFDKCRSLL